MEAAACEGNVEAVKALLESGHPADPVPPPQQTFEEELNEFADHMGFDEKLLEEHRGMIIKEMETQTNEGKWGVKDPSAVSALALAARGGHLDVVFALLAGGAVANRGYGLTDRTPLHDVVDCVLGEKNGIANLAFKGGAFGEKIKALVWALTMSGAQPDRPPRVAHAEALSPLDYARSMVPKKVDAMAVVRVLKSGAERTTRQDRNSAEGRELARQTSEAARRAASRPEALTKRLSPGRAGKVVSKVLEEQSFRYVQDSDDPLSTLPRYETAASVRGNDSSSSPGEASSCTSVTRLVGGPAKNWGRGRPKSLEESTSLCLMTLKRAQAMGLGPDSRADQRGPMAIKPTPTKDRKR
eukprot:COSAG05_NODE_2467_length_3028_cov_4.291909_3_plen_356_part_00